MLKVVVGRMGSGEQYAPAGFESQIATAPRVSGPAAGWARGATRISSLGSPTPWGMITLA